MALVVIQARMGSTRLPGKVLVPLGPSERPVLGWVIRAAKEAEVGSVAVATTTEPEDDAVAQLCGVYRVPCVRGDAEDVLARYIRALDVLGDPAPRPGRLRGRGALVRLTADCPLLDPALIRVAVSTFESGDLDYVSNGLPEHRTLPHGLDVEVVASDALRVAAERATGADRAHVCSYVYRNPEQFRVFGLVVSPSAADLRVTLDEPDDLAALQAIVAARVEAGAGEGPPPWRELVALLRDRPDLVAMNASVRQKSVEEG